MFKINFFELLFLAEVCIPPVPIARHSFFQNLSDIHYKNMSREEQQQLLDVISKDPKFDLKNEDCRHFFVRFRESSQYIVELTDNSVVDCYLYNEKYHKGKDVWINPDKIKSAKQKYQQ